MMTLRRRLKRRRDSSPLIQTKQLIRVMMTLRRRLKRTRDSSPLIQTKQLINIQAMTVCLLKNTKLKLDTLIERVELKRCVQPQDERGM